MKYQPYIGQSEGAQRLLAERKAMVKTVKLHHEKRHKNVIISLRNLIVTATEIDESGKMKRVYEREHHPTMCVYIYCKLLKEYQHKGYEITGQINEDVEPKKRGRKKKVQEVVIEEPKSEPVKIERSKEHRVRKTCKYEERINRLNAYLEANPTLMEAQ